MPENMFYVFYDFHKDYDSWVTIWSINLKTSETSGWKNDSDHLERWSYGDDLRSTQQSMIYRGSTRPHQKISWHYNSMKQGPHNFCHNYDMTSESVTKMAK